MAKAFLPEGELAATCALLAQLVAFPTVSDQPNRPLIEAVASSLRDAGIEPLVVSAGEGDKAGLIATIGPDVPGGIILSGHTDVVPVFGQRWNSDPFCVVERSGRYYGRGTADMKAFLAAVLALVPRCAGAPLRRPVHLVFSWDEEIGCLGAPVLIETLLARRARPAIALVGEPTGMQVADRHRGIATFTTTVTGIGGHSAAPERGVNAIGLAARFVTELERHGRAFSEAAGIRRVDADDTGNTPEYSTVNVGRIEGGVAVNMIAEFCRIDWECRPAPGTTADQLLADVRRFVERDLLAALQHRRGVAVATEPVLSVPPLPRCPDSPAVALGMRLTGTRTTIAAPFASEAGLFQQAGIPAMVCGPGHVREAHQPDEFVDIEQVRACLAMLRGVIAWASGHADETRS